MLNYKSFEVLLNVRQYDSISLFMEFIELLMVVIREHLFSFDPVLSEAEI